MTSVTDQALRSLSSALPRPGEVLHLDFRRPAEGSGSAAHGQISPSQHLRAVTWNIERGYKLDAVVAELQKIDADIIALQEVDVGCERSDSKDTGRVIAQALRMDYAFLCEFEELHSPLRDANSQGGGVHGNAILSRYSLSNIRVVQHSHHPVDWVNPVHPLAQREPRHGRRAVLAATVDSLRGPILVYCLHLEVFCGMLARISQFADVLRDSKEQLRQGMVHQMILGDLNTMAHGVARLSPHYCCDAMRWRALGWYEAAWWHAHVLSQEDTVYSLERDAARLPGEETTGSNVVLQRLGIQEDVCKDVLNPGFVDPFDPVRDVTLDNPAYRVFGFSLMKGKLDWLLLRRLAVSATAMGNHNYSASDHKWLSADVTLA